MKGHGTGGALPGNLTLPLTFDNAGNLRDEDRQAGTAAVKYRYTHDAWNRLLHVQAGSNQFLGLCGVRFVYHLNHPSPLLD